MRKVFCVWKCKICGKDLNDIEYHLNSHYCYDCRIIVQRKKNQKHYDKIRTTKINENCLMCGISLTNSITGKRRVKFCSQKCALRYNWLTVQQPKRPSPIIPCKICHVKFKRVKSQVYCSMYCRGVGLSTQKPKKLIKVVAK